jgi:hypothetical protein
MSDFWDFMQPKGVNLMSETALTEDKTGTTRGAVGQGLAQVTLDCIACAGSATVADKLDVYVDRSPDGVSWVNAAHFPQIAGNAAAKKYVAYLDHQHVASPATTTTDVSADLAANTVRPALQGGYWRARAVLTIDDAPEWEFSVGVHGE